MAEPLCIICAEQMPLSVLNHITSSGKYWVGDSEVQSRDRI